MRAHRAVNLEDLLCQINGRAARPSWRSGGSCPWRRGGPRRTTVAGTGLPCPTPSWTTGGSRFSMAQRELTLQPRAKVGGADGGPVGDPPGAVTGSRCRPWTTARGGCRGAVGRSFHRWTTSPATLRTGGGGQAASARWPYSGAGFTGVSPAVPPGGSSLPRRCRCGERRRPPCGKGPPSCEPLPKP